MLQKGSLIAPSSSPDIIFKYTTPSEMDVIVSTCGSDFDTLLSIFTYDKQNKIESLFACDDDSGVAYCARGDLHTFDCQICCLL